ncbi:50S ribosomal protein L24e [Halopelagius longus]|uniref:Large ribosomal subunit protein eL24 n=1 Tax=Halopelagius longus TaxID=1236180 RepID=A0A1H0Z2H9_9EURY|nr:50S ribosomal protein L24e [Halopelagius longus]RDI72800.1 50S ribosomal protein L24e [Halopelagius longus]SDQ21697.1 LSU ribosomal protein L24E [Halopelagius longus]
MVEKRTCDFSGEEIEPGTGTMYVKNDGTILHFKDSKAEKNYFLGREARDVEWTAEGQAAGGPSQENAEE